MRYRDLETALNIFKKYKPNGLIHAEHEYIYTYFPVRDVSQEDKDILKSLGWIENVDYFCIFVENQTNDAVHGMRKAKW